jgi:hypothetical protein
MKSNTIIIGSFACVISLLFVSGCKKKDNTNESLYKEAKDAGLTFYKDKDTIYSPAGGSPHGNFKLKMNSIAKSKVNSSGVLPPGETFPNSALIVKEVYKNGALEMYAVIKKQSSSEFVASGWMWAEYAPDGKVLTDVAKKGEGCVSCHSGGTNRDLVRSFDLH